MTFTPRTTELSTNHNFEEHSCGFGNPFFITEGRNSSQSHQFMTHRVLQQQAVVPLKHEQPVCAATTVCCLFTASYKPKTSSHPFSPKDTLLLREGGRGGVQQQLQQQFHLARAAGHPQKCRSLSTYEKIWV